jgi:hypothetical protein
VLRLRLRLDILLRPRADVRLHSCNQQRIMLRRSRCAQR